MMQAVRLRQKTRCAAQSNVEATIATTVPFLIVTCIGRTWQKKHKYKIKMVPKYCNFGLKQISVVKCIHGGMYDMVCTLLIALPLILLDCGKSQALSDHHLPNINNSFRNLYSH